MTLLKAKGDLQPRQEYACRRGPRGSWQVDWGNKRGPCE